MGKCRFLAVFNGYQLRELNVFSYISRLESRKKLPPGKEKMGFDFWLKGAMPSGFSHKYLMLAEWSFTLSKHRFCH